MRSPWRAGLAILVIVLALAAAGCSSSKKSSSSDSGPGSQFCQTNKSINDSFNSVSSPDDIPAAVKKAKSKIDDFLSEAPASQKDNAQTLHDAAEKVISTNSADAFNTDAVQKAGSEVDAYCGTPDTSS